MDIGSQGMYCTPRAILQRIILIFLVSIPSLLGQLA